MPQVDRDGNRLVSLMQIAPQYVEQVRIGGTFRLDEVLFHPDMRKCAGGVVESCYRVASRFCPQCSENLCSNHTAAGKCVRCDASVQVTVILYPDTLAVVSYNWARERFCGRRYLVIDPMHRAIRVGDALWQETARVPA